MTVKELRLQVANKAMVMTVEELINAKKSIQSKFDGGGDLEEFLIANDVLNDELIKREKSAVKFVDNLC